MSILDDASRVHAADPGGMLDVSLAAADHWHDALARARAADLAHLPDHSGIANVVVCGMGGSGIAGDVVATIAAGRAAVPVTVVKGYELPAFASHHTLAVMVSYSGDTEETLACFAEAHDRGVPALVVATGGRLAELALSHGLPCVAPAPGLQPRAAFPYLSAAPLVVLERLGVLPDLTGDLVELDAVLREQAAAVSADVDLARNPAKRLASALDGSVPVVWGQEGVLAVAALRWKTQFNENAKMPAFSSALPELDHNEVVGFDPGVAALRDLAIVVLRGTAEPPRIASRIEATVSMVRDRVARVEEAAVRGASSLARLASAVQLGDVVSTYLAILRGVDPTPVDAIARLKSALR